MMTNTKTSNEKLCFWYRKKSRNRSRENLVPKKVPESVSKKIGTEKSLGTGHRNILSQSRNFPVSRLSYLTCSNLLYPFLIFTSQFLVRILVSVWVLVSVSSRSQNQSPRKYGTEKSPGTGLGENLVPKKVPEPVSERIWYRKKSPNRSRSDIWVPSHAEYK